MRMEFSDTVLALTAEAEQALRPRFEGIDRVAFANTARVMEALAARRAAASDFCGSDGYGYGDRGRDKLEEVWADVMGAEAAVVRQQIMSGTHALAIGLFALLRPGDVLLSVSGRPYDTLAPVIGLDGRTGDGSLRDFGVTYDEADLLPDGAFDFPLIERKLLERGRRVGAVYVQRSKGYLNRKTLSVRDIGALCRFVKERLPGVRVIADNCYGEFVEEREPPAVGCDLTIGSLIKNPGGGMAETGGYAAGTAKAVELFACRLTAPGVGREIGASLGQNKSFYKGLFYAPHTVAQALKTAHLAAYLFARLGYAVEPAWDEVRRDIVQTIVTGSPERLCAFCRAVQAASPIDAHVTPEPWPMPGYADPVIMAAGGFTEGASIELSADGPMRPPYTAFFQGGLTYESGRYAMMRAADALLRAGPPPSGEGAVP